MLCFGFVSGHDFSRAVEAANKTFIQFLSGVRNASSWDKTLAFLENSLAQSNIRRRFVFKPRARIPLQLFGY